MLDRPKLIEAFSSISSKLFLDRSQEVSFAKGVWNKISQDLFFQNKVTCSQSSFLIPGWKGNLSGSFTVSSGFKDYSVVAVDGSQVYPDRNMPGSGCFLINLGVAYLNYGEELENVLDRKAAFFSEPYLFLMEDLTIKDSAAFSQRDFVDLKREEFELKIALEKASEFKTTICLFDGSLIFWHLEGKGKEIKKLFLDMYLSYLNQFYERKILIAGYISYPKSRELVNLIKLGLCRFSTADCIQCHKEYDTFPCKKVDHIVDMSVAKFFLRSGERTTLFWSNSKIVQDYPSYLRPYFFYLDVGAEVARVEIPAWIAENDLYVDKVCKVILDQATKGRGYPVCLAEAHEHAVVKGVDRDFFYHLVCKESLEAKRRIVVSQKSIKKKGLGI